MSTAHSSTSQGDLSIRMGSIEYKENEPSATTPNDTKTFQRVEFSPPFSKGTSVVVVPMVQTFNGTDSPGLRLSDVDHQGFKFRINELVVNDGGTKTALSDGKHKPETIGWIAMAAG